MAVTLTTSQLGGGYTQQTLADAIVAAFQPILGTPISRYTSGTDLRAVWLAPNIGGSDRDTYLVIDVTTGHLIRASGATSFTAPSTIGTLHQQSSSTFSTTGTPINLTVVYKAGESILLILTQSTTRGYFGLVAPATLSSWWVRANASPWLVMSGSAFNSAVTHLAPPNAYGTPTNLTAASQASFTIRHFLSAVTENPALARREVVTGVTFGAQAGHAGHSSNDFGAVAASGLLIFDTIAVSPGVEEYMLIENPANQALVVRAI